MSLHSSYCLFGVWNSHRLSLTIFICLTCSAELLKCKVLLWASSLWLLQGISTSECLTWTLWIPILWSTMMAFPRTWQLWASTVTWSGCSQVGRTTLQGYGISGMCVCICETYVCTCVKHQLKSIRVIGCWGLFFCFLTFHLFVAGNSGHLTWVRLKQPREQCHPFLAVHAGFLYVQTKINGCQCLGSLACVRTNSIATGAAWTPKESLHWKLTVGEKSLAALENRTCLSSMLGQCSTNWATSLPQNSCVCVCLCVVFPSSVQGGIYMLRKTLMCFTPSLSSFSSVAYETFAVVDLLKAKERKIFLFVCRTEK